MNFSNAQIAKMLYDVAASYALKKGNLFQNRAYENAASTIEGFTSEVQDLWEQGNLDQVPGIGESLKEHLEELFKTGKVKHWEQMKEGIPEGVFDFLEIPGVGPKTAQELSKLGAKDTTDLKEKFVSGDLVKKGFSEKLAGKILENMEGMGKTKTGRMLLPYAYAQAEKILDYLRKCPYIKEANVLGSLRRMAATIGDLDFSISSNEPKKVIEHIISMPGARVEEAGDTKASLILPSGLHLDFLIAQPDTYGALLQHFTGSKAHNIHLKTIAEKKGLSLSEYGVKSLKKGEIKPMETEEEFYSLLKMEVPPPEIREDTGEIEAALEHKLPQLIKPSDIMGDLHLHSSFDIEPSHDLGVNSIEEIIGKAKELGYSYIGLSEHQPSVSKHTEEQITGLIRKKKRLIEQFNYSDKTFRVLNLLELDIIPDGSISVSDEALKLLDFVLAGVHSVHKMPKDKMTARIMKALKNPYVKVLTHPTGRLLNERDSYDADWEEIFKYAAKNHVAMEINSYPNRLDLSDLLIRMAKSFGVKFVVDTDAHEISQMDFMRFGVAMAKRGWAEKGDIVNSWELQKMLQWFKI